MNREYRIICTKFGVDAGSRFCSDCEDHDECAAVDIEDRLDKEDFCYLIIAYIKPDNINKTHEKIPVIYGSGIGAKQIGYIDRIIGNKMYVCLEKTYALHSFTLSSIYKADGNLSYLLYKRGEI